MIYPLQGLRAIAALYVLFHHSTQLRGMFDNTGEFCVAILFILSGFLMAGKHVKKARLFTAEKIAKLYPVNIACLLVAVYIFRKELFYRWPAYLCNLFLVQSWIPDADFYFFSGDPVSWFLSDIMLAYLLFPLLSKLYRNNFTSAIILFVSLCAATIFAAEFIYPKDKIDGLVYIAPYSRILDFMAGMIAGTLAAGRRFNATKAQAVALTMLILAFVLVSFIPKSISLTFWWYLPCCILIMSLSQGDGRTGFLGKALSVRPLVWVGDISFGVFMYHFPIIWIMDVSAHKFEITISPALQLVLALVLTLAVAALSKKYFEKPVNDAIRRHFQSQRES